MRYAIRIQKDGEVTDTFGEVCEIGDAVAIADRHPDSYIYDRQTGAIL